MQFLFTYKDIWPHDIGPFPLDSVHSVTALTHSTKVEQVQWHTFKDYPDLVSDASDERVHVLHAVYIPLHGEEVASCLAMHAQGNEYKVARHTTRND